MAEVPELDRRIIDATKGTGHRHSNTAFGSLSQNLKDRIDAVDLTVHDLLREIIIQEKIRNLHLESWTDENITPKDIKWP